MMRAMRAATAVLAIFAGSALAAEPIQESDYSAPIRVACVGDSITFGAGIADRKNKSYPVQWGRVLGAKWDVKNFGVNGATLLKKGDKPYWKLEAYTKALAFNPNVVVIKLGTNDTKPQNWKHKADYVADYVALIKSFQALEAKPKIWLCYPVPAYADKWGIFEKVIREEVKPMLDQVQAQTKCPIIDLYSALSDKADLFPDKIHPNAAGAALMVKEIHKAVTGKTVK